MMEIQQMEMAAKDDAAIVINHFYYYVASLCLISLTDCSESNKENFL